MKILTLVAPSLAFLWANIEAYPSPNAMSKILLAYRFVTEGTARISDFVALAWHDTSERWRYVLATSIVFAIVIQVAGLLAYYHFWNGVNRDDARVQVDDADAARQMWDLSDPQWSSLIPVTLIFGYVAFRAGLARPTASVVHQKIA